jgi:integrase/recombinase XerC
VTSPSDAALPASDRALIAAWARHLETHPSTTRVAYLRDIDALRELADGRSLTSLGIAEVRRALATLHQRGLAPSSLARMLSAWRAFYRYAGEHGTGVRANPCAGVRAPRKARRLPSALSPDEAARLVAIEGEDRLSLRDHALFELAYSSGLRVSELSGLDVDALDLDAGEVRVWGKGSKQRVVPVGAAARTALAAWLTDRAGIGAGDTKALFLSARGRRLGARAIQQRLAAWAVRQGISQHVHPHMLRHSFASHVLQSSGDLRAVQEMLGHASIASTQIYTHLDFQALAKTYDQAHPRARKRPRR